MNTRILSRHLIGISLVLGLSCFPSQSVSQQIILDDIGVEKYYLLNLSGTVMNETFTGVQALLTIMPPAPLSTRPYQITINGFPKTNSRNSFFWNSEHTDMTAIANEITCEIKLTAVKRVPMYFAFLSPELLKLSSTLVPQGEEQKKYTAEKIALPQLINASAGKLKLVMNPNSISGTVWMKGYDAVEKAYVLYNAQIRGERSYKLEPQRELKR